MLLVQYFMLVLSTFKTRKQDLCFENQSRLRCGLLSKLNNCSAVFLESEKGCYLQRSKSTDLASEFKDVHGISYSPFIPGEERNTDGVDIDSKSLESQSTVNRQQGARGQKDSRRTKEIDTRSKKMKKHGQKRLSQTQEKFQGEKRRNLKTKEKQTSKKKKMKKKKNRLSSKGRGMKKQRGKSSNPSQRLRRTEKKEPGMRTVKGLFARKRYDERHKLLTAVTTNNRGSRMASTGKSHTARLTRNTGRRWKSKVSPALKQTQKRKGRSVNRRGRSIKRNGGSMKRRGRSMKRNGKNCESEKGLDMKRGCKEKNEINVLDKTHIVLEMDECVRFQITLKKKPPITLSIDRAGVFCQYARQKEKFKTCKFWDSEELNQFWLMWVSKTVSIGKGRNVGQEKLASFAFRGKLKIKGIQIKIQKWREGQDKVKLRITDL